MTTVLEKFEKLKTEHAPGQEVRQKTPAFEELLIGEKLEGRTVDFSHGDVDAFLPTPGAFEEFSDGVHSGGKQAYTVYRGLADLREILSVRLTSFTGAPVNAADNLIITPGTQGALFLSVAATVAAGDKVAIVQPDYFANRKLVEFFEAEMLPVQLDYLGTDKAAGLDLNQLEAAFRDGARVFVFSNPNNPTGAVYSTEEIDAIAALADRYGAMVIVDQLYSRLLYEGTEYQHLRAVGGTGRDNVITIMGPSKTESLSGYRLGVAFGPSSVIERMERLQAIVSLRAAGYNQAVLQTWFSEPDGWMSERIKLHQAIRDDLLTRFRARADVAVRTPQAGSYMFAKLPRLRVSPIDFVKILRHQARVIVTPGSEFSPHTASSIRLNFSQNHAAATGAVERLVTLIERYREARP
ncbi:MULTISPECIES: pyridoxal phosphate-dependent aminotransferase [Rhizobium/Agrobacterium group]|uniref:pyridoxal phosphate-dependent aminotransferase n=1 Tax=Rhizobium/Agrobacterium group TaxID=227290 RepID=UPI0008FB9D7C|nr:MULTISPECIES: pyridoxal phosphate-dependent aminotransferase [Rhizobium/Agrobacterium group]MCF1465001.1 pyridoxal phosphate-dependent aminotransferase [Allorhizobium ampelinum]MCF1496173.1 pyridoxal phosphate-dependent aminotransferase [Allorhizobium ampelinum]MUZ55343.1 aminotransferase class I/II-fold pyridoxal phosphate-dependent enzyme [Agrobacterium vitis]MUZ94646.1 aminotransferase class I/II-fold pyridoxal phosphate-dependent enzyme [Agrobacterium vitis]MVA43332.1 aminotransferase c